MINQNLEMALKYRQELKWSVIPIKPKSKEPLFQWKEYQKRFPPIEQVKKWWTENPHAGIGVVCGKISNLVVVDIDGENGNETLKSNEIFLDDQPTPVSKTYRGHQYFYSYPEDDPIKSFSFDGGEIRSDGNYVCVDPSIHPEGIPYNWLISPFDSKPVILSKELVASFQAGL